MCTLWPLNLPFATKKKSYLFLLFGKKFLLFLTSPTPGHPVFWKKQDNRVCKTYISDFGVFNSAQHMDPIVQLASFTHFFQYQPFGSIPTWRTKNQCFLRNPYRRISRQSFEADQQSEQLTNDEMKIWIFITETRYDSCQEVRSFSVHKSAHNNHCDCNNKMQEPDFAAVATAPQARDINFTIVETAEWYLDQEYVLLDQA